MIKPESPGSGVPSPPRAAPSAPARGGQDATSALVSSTPLEKTIPARSAAEHSGNQSVNQSGNGIFASIALASREGGAGPGCGSPIPGPALLFGPGMLRAPRVPSGSPGDTSDRLPGGPGREALDQA